MSTTSTTTALAGLSGYDFSSVIDMMVTQYRQPETRMQSQQNDLKTQQSAWQTAKTRISALENTLAALKDPATWTATQVTSSNTDLLGVTGGTSTVTGTYNVTVKNLAKAWTAVTGVITADSATAKLSGDSAITTDQTFQINGTDITIKANSSLNDIQNAINSQSGKTGVKASVVQVDNGKYQLSLTSTKSGEANVPTFSDDGGFLSSILGINLVGGKVGNTYDSSNSATGGVTVEAEDAEIVVNGLTIKNSSNTITTAIQGVTLNLNEADPSKTIKVSVDEDYSVAQKAVQSFIDQYNSLMSFVDDETNYDATTETAGTLYADPTLRDIQSHLSLLMGDVWQIAGTDSDAHQILANLGITTSSDDFGESSALTFDTDQFQAALKDNLQQVANLFGAKFNGIDPSDSQYESTGKGGIANVLEDYLHPMVKFQGTLDQTNDSFTEQIKDLQDQINDFETRANDYEDRIKLQFANLETALTALNQQSSSFTSMLASLKSQTSTGQLRAKE